MSAAWSERWVELRERGGAFYAYETGILSVGESATPYWVERMIAGPHPLLAVVGLKADRYAAERGLEVIELHEDAEAA